MPGSDKRQYVRVKIAVEVEVVTGLVHTHKPRTLYGSCLDLSVNGALLVLGESLELDDEILVSFHVYSEWIECAAIVLRIEPTVKLGRWRIGCQFQGVSEDTYRKLSRYVNAKLKATILTSR